MSLLDVRQKWRGCCGGKKKKEKKWVKRRTAFLSTRILGALLRSAATVYHRCYYSGKKKEKE